VRVSAVETTAKGQLGVNLRVFLRRG
jgi:hypothetical protein